MLGVYTLVLAAGLPAAEWLRRRTGSARLGVIGFVVFALAGLGCGAVDSLAPLLVLRAVQALGAAAGLVSRLRSADLGRGRPRAAVDRGGDLRHRRRPRARRRPHRAVRLAGDLPRPGADRRARCCGVRSPAHDAAAARIRERRTPGAGPPEAARRRARAHRGARPGLGGAQRRPLPARPPARLGLVDLAAGGRADRHPASRRRARRDADPRRPAASRRRGLRPCRRRGARARLPQLRLGGVDLRAAAARRRRHGTRAHLARRPPALRADARGHRLPARRSPRWDYAGAAPACADHRRAARLGRHRHARARRRARPRRGAAAARQARPGERGNGRARPGRPARDAAQLTRRGCRQLCGRPGGGRRLYRAGQACGRDARRWDRPRLHPGLPDRRRARAARGGLRPATP